jgi:hypothetical protein
LPRLMPLARLPRAFTVAPNSAEVRHRNRLQRYEEQQARRRAWIREQRLSPAEEPYIPADFDPAFPYPRDDACTSRTCAATGSSTMPVP